MIDCARSLNRAGRVAVGVAQDFSAGRVGRRLRDLRHLHRQRVGEARVAAGVRQPHRVVRRDAAEGFVQRKAFDVGRRRRRPLLLMPAAAQDPLARPRAFRGIANHADDVVPVLGGPAASGFSRGFANAGEMRVRVDEAGYGERALQIDDARRRADQSLDLRVRSDRDDRCRRSRRWLRRRAACRQR